MLQRLAHVSDGQPGRQRRRRRTIGAATALLALMALAGCGGGGTDAAADFPERTIRWVTPGEAGGGLDISSQQLEPSFEEALGGDIQIEYIPGGGTSVGATVVAEEGDDCHAVVLVGIPHLLFGILQNDVDITYEEDFYPVGSLYVEPSVIRVQNDAPWQTLQELVDDALSRPGEITASVSTLSSNNYVGMLQLQETTGAEFNSVAFDGGGPSRNALLRGEVDLTHAGVFNSLPIQDETRVLAVHDPVNSWPEVTNDAPTVNDALGVDLPANGSTIGLFVNTACHEEQPERYQALRDAFEASLQDEEYLATLEELGEAGKLYDVSAEDYHEDVIAEFEALGDLIARYPELSGG